MNWKKALTLVLLTVFFASCKMTSKLQTQQNAWFNLSTSDDVDIYIDTLSIIHKDAVSYAIEKRVYVSPASRDQYVAKIRREYEKMRKPEKADKWNDFSYCIYHSVYECVNKRFRVLSVEDYDSQGKLIVRTQNLKNEEKWLNIEPETVGDYTFFFVCDYGF